MKDLKDLRPLVDKVLNNHKQEDRYKAAFSDDVTDAGVSIYETSRAILTADVLEELEKYPNIDAEAELRDMFVEQLHMESYVRALRAISDNKPGTEITLVDLAEAIKKMPGTHIAMVSAEVYAQLNEKVRITQLPKGRKFFMGVEEAGAINGKPVFVNPYLAVGKVYILPEKFASYSFESFEGVKPGPGIQGEHISDPAYRFMVHTKVNVKDSEWFTVPEVKEFYDNMQ